MKLEIFEINQIAVFQAIRLSVQDLIGIIMNKLFGIICGVVFFGLGFFLYPGFLSFGLYFIGAFFFITTFKKR